MSKRDGISMNQGNSDEFTPSGWVLALLQPESGNPPFQERCASAAETARDMLRLSHASKHFGYSFLNIKSYLRGLSAVAGVPLDRVLKWAGLNLEESPNAHFARGWSRVANRLGLELRQAVWHLRLTFAELAGMDVPAVAARPTTAPPGLDAQARECEAELAVHIDHWDEELRSTLQECEHEVQCDYGEAEANDLCEE